MEWIKKEGTWPDMFSEALLTVDSVQIPRNFFGFQTHQMFQPPSLRAPLGNPQARGSFCGGTGTLQAPGGS